MRLLAVPRAIPTETANNADKFIEVRMRHGGIFSCHDTQPSHFIPDLQSYQNLAILFPFNLVVEGRLMR
jgi:preprotein translocase subunit SecB